MTDCKDLKIENSVQYPFPEFRFPEFLFSEDIMSKQGVSIRKSLTAPSLYLVYRETEYFEGIVCSSKKGAVKTFKKMLKA